MSNGNSHSNYAFSRFVGWGLTACVGIQLVAGVLAVFVPDQMGMDRDTLRLVCALGFAGICAFALAAGNCCAAHASAAFAAGKAGRHVFWPAVLLAVLFCGASLLGVDLGWSILKATNGEPIELPADELIFLASLLLAPAKPTMQWIVEGRIALDLAAAASEERQAIDLAREREARQESAQERRDGMRRGVGMAGAAVAALGLMSQSPRAAAQTDRDTSPTPKTAPADMGNLPEQIPAHKPPPPGLNARDRDRFETVRDLFREGVKRPKIISQTGIPKTTVYRWTDYLKDVPLAA